MPARRRSFYCSISDADRDPGLEYLATTYNGIDPAQFTFSDKPGEYLCFLGRFHPEKGTHLAIEIAKRAGVRLKIAAIPQDEAYFREQVAPHIDGDRVQFLGAVEREARNELLSNALALVHMTTRPERFGLTMIEAMACGTPVLGARMGSIPEIVVDGVTGFLCDSVDDAVAAVPLLASLDRRACRARVEGEFSVERMVDRYLERVRACARDCAFRPRRARRLSAIRRHDWWDRPMAYTEIPPKPRSLGLLMKTRVERDYSGRSLFEKLGVFAEAHVALVGPSRRRFRDGLKRARSRKSASQALRTSLRSDLRARRRSARSRAHQARRRTSGAERRALGLSSQRPRRIADRCASAFRRHCGRARRQ